MSLYNINTIFDYPYITAMVYYVGFYYHLLDCATYLDSRHYVDASRYVQFSNSMFFFFFFRSSYKLFCAVLTSKYKETSIASQH